MASGDIYRLSAVGDWAGVESAIVTSHWRMKSSGGTPQGAALVWRTYLLELLDTYQTNQWNWRYINWLSVNLTPPVAGVYTTGFPIPGIVSGESLPYTVACVVSLRSAYSGRSYRGRMYIPAMLELQSAAGRFLSTLVNAYQTYFEDLLAAVGSGGSHADYELGVYSRTLSQFNPYASVIVRDVPGTIRRRRPGVGT